MGLPAPLLIMNNLEQLKHSLDINGRLQDYIVELNSMTHDVEPSQVANHLTSILARAEDARFELKCGQADFELAYS